MDDGSQPTFSEVRIHSSEEWAAVAADLLNRGVAVRLRADGASMSPAIRSGDWIWVVPLKSERLPIGGILLYQRSDGRPVIHRTVAARETPLGVAHYIVSDCVLSWGEWIYVDRILGRVRSVERKGQQLSLYGWRNALYGRVVRQCWRIYRIFGNSATVVRVTRLFQRCASRLLFRLF